jgi:hypothetical protein
LGIPGDANPSSVEEMAKGTVVQKNLRCDQPCVGYWSPYVAGKSIHFGKSGAMDYLGVSLYLKAIKLGNEFLEYHAQANVLARQMYARGVSVWFREDTGKLTLYSSYLEQYRSTPHAEIRNNLRTYTNIGTNTEWDEKINIPVWRIEKAINTNTPIVIIVGRPASDFRSHGSLEEVLVPNTDIVGVTLSIRPESLQGFNQAIRTNGGVIPSAAEVARRDQAEEAKLQAAANQRANLRAERNAREMPMKKTIGTRICKMQNGWEHRGFVEKVAGEKIQIRISDIHMGSSRPGNFKQDQIIWDSPNNWNVCE